MEKLKNFPHLYIYSSAYSIKIPLLCSFIISSFLLKAYCVPPPVVFLLYRSGTILLINDLPSSPPPLLFMFLLFSYAQYISLDFLSLFITFLLLLESENKPTSCLCAIINKTFFGYSGYVCTSIFASEFWLWLTL
jgi:hypothetical protein